MIPTGISPIEAAFEVIGLVNAKSIMDFMFFETKIGLAIFLIGLLTALWRSAKEADFSILWSYLFMFCALLFIFIKPMAGLENATSTMEVAGWKGTSTQDSLKEAFLDSGKARTGSLGLVFISRGYNAVVFGTVSAITKVTQAQDFNYLKNPFIVNKVSLYLQDFTADGITKDKDLRKDIRDFLKNDYPQALGRMAQGKKQTLQITGKWWPGDSEVVASYDPEQRARWDALEARLGKYIDDERSRLDPGAQFTAMLTDRKTLEIKLLSGEMRKTAAELAFNISGYGLDQRALQGSWSLRKLFGGSLAYLGSFVGQLLSTTMAEFMIKALPYLQGYAVMIIYSLFPFTLLLCLLFGTYSILKEYFIYLFWVKSWVIVWALIHYASIYIYTLQASLNSGTTNWFIERPYFNTVTGVLLVMSPGIAWFMTKGILTGIGEAATALTLHADKGVGKVGSKIGV